MSREFVKNIHKLYYGYINDIDIFGFWLGNKTLEELYKESEVK